MQGKRVFPATIDNQVWPRQTNKDALLVENGFNLFDGPLEMIDRVQLLQDSVLVAFDFPVALVNSLASTFGIVPLPIDLLLADESWTFLGYDIVDVRTQCSGIYSFEWTEMEFADICKRISLTLNSAGLVDDESLAIQAAVSFDLLVNEHAPFAPCGVWIDRHEQTGTATD
jgi:hypothetical protein